MRRYVCNRAKFALVICSVGCLLLLGGVFNRLGESQNVSLLEHGGSKAKSEIQAPSRDATQLVPKIIEPVDERANTSAAEFEIRRQRVEEVCKTEEKVVGSVWKTFIDESSGVLYCQIAKAGSTFWKRVFHVLNETKYKNETDTELQDDVFHVDRHLVHKDKAVKFNASIHTADRFPIRMLVARDPFSRVLSAYLDKAYLPDLWPNRCFTIYETLRAKEARREMANLKVKLNHTAHDYARSSDFFHQHFQEMIFSRPEFNTRQDQKDNPHGANDKCSKFLSLAQYVEEDIHRKEEHTLPIHTMCQPCEFNVTHVINMDSFTRDSRSVLAKMGLEHILDDVDEDKQLEIEFETLVDYNFKRIDHWFFKQNKCITNRELAFRLWQNFQWRGYIDPDMSYEIPEEFDNADAVRTDLLVQLWRARRSGLWNRAKMKRAKKEFKKRAFSSLRPSLLKKLMERYRLDFKFFDFEHRKAELLSTLHSDEDTL